MTALQYRTLLAAAFALASAHAAGSQVRAPASAPEPKPNGYAIIAWEEDFDRPSGEQPVLLGEHRVLLARNDSSAPITITQVRLSQCVNITLACGPVALWKATLAPGQMRRLFSVMPANSGKSYHFRYDLDWHTATECIGMPPVLPGADTAVARGPEPTVLILPPLGTPQRLRGKAIAAQFFIAATGKIDSLSITGVPEGKDLDPIRATLAKYQFKPALNHDCPVAGTMTARITF